MWEMKETIFLVLCLSASMDKFACLDFPLNKNTCTSRKVEETNSRHMCIDGYGCSYYKLIYNKTIICSNISLNNLILHKEANERSIFRYPVILEVIDSEIPVLPPHTFKNFDEINITTLILENIKLKTIMTAAFGFLHNITEIYLGGNELTEVSDGIFNTMPQLEILDLSNNDIQTISVHAFVGTSLRELNLYKNHVSGVEKTFFDPPIQLNNNSLHGSSQRNLNLSQNSIEFIDFEILKRVSGHADISFNSISKIINFSLSQATELILSHNEITSFEKNNYVKVLDLSYNRIKALGSDLFNLKLLKFFASFNSISLVNTNAFFGLSDLTHLYLDSNNISSIPNSCFKDLTSLTHLNLSTNRLTYFNFGTFDSLLHLQVLDISVNDLKELPQFSIHSLTELTHLYFQDNKINDIDINALVEHLRQLMIINLNNNLWLCHKLANIVHTLKKCKVSITDGNSWEESNIHGIQCYEIFTNPNSNNNSKLEMNFSDSKVNSFFNEEFTKTQMYKYFNQDFRRSDMYNYFNKDFRGSNFFKYLENLNKMLPINRTDKYANDMNNFRTEKLIGSHENTFEYPNYTGLLSIIATILLIIACIVAVVGYRLFHNINTFTMVKKEEVELI